MCRVKRGSHLFDDRHRTDGIYTSTAQHRIEVAPLDQPHVDVQLPVDLAEVVNGHHVRVVQPRGDACLAAKPLLEEVVVDQLSRKYLDGDNPRCLGVVRPPYLAHAAAPEQCQ
jgi:hypothetical protein